VITPGVPAQGATTRPPTARADPGVRYECAKRSLAGTASTSEQQRLDQKIEAAPLRSDFFASTGIREWPPSMAQAASGWRLDDRTEPNEPSQQQERYRPMPSCRRTRIRIAKLAFPVNGVSRSSGFTSPRIRVRERNQPMYCRQANIIPAATDYGLFRSGLAPPRSPSPPRATRILWSNCPPRESIPKS